MGRAGDTEAALTSDYLTLTCSYIVMNRVMKYFFELKRDDGGTTKSLMINPVKQHKVNEASRKVNS